MSIKRFNEMKSERLRVKPETLCKLFICGEKEADGFALMEDEITGSDPEDGGADHDYVIKELSTGRFFSGSYTDWDIENTDYDDEEDKCGNRVDFNCNLLEVFPEQITKTIYRSR